MSTTQPEGLPAGGLPEEFLAGLARNSPDAIVYADAQGHIRFWNQAATRIFGFPESEALGATLDLIIPERLRPRHWQGYNEVMQGRESRYAEGALLAVPAMHRDGRQISVEFTILGLTDASGATLGIAAFLRDATARFEETRALRRELAALKAQAAAPGETPAP
ncbi:MAG TPA: PAS domain S-box protein [Stellaceae bacterium]|jgi:PAS domain S-box-containing protein|nr:PAS domain S-box protein [Stellaceae bacterium]